MSPESQSPFSVQVPLHDAGVGVAVAVRQVQSVSLVQVAFLHIPSTQESPDAQLTPFPQVWLQAAGVGVIISVRQVQLAWVLHCGFLHIPPTHERPSAQSVVSEQDSLHTFFVASATIKVALHCVPPVQSAARGLLSGAAGDTLCLPEIL
jgi:hypothetical protein